MKLNDMKWIKFTERECDMFTAHCIMMGYLKGYKKYIGRNIDNFLMMHVNGMVHSWRLEKEYGQLLILLRKKGSKSLETVLDKLDFQNNQINNYLEISKSKIISYTDKELLLLFKKFLSDYKDYFSLFTLPKYFGMVLSEGDLSPLAIKKLKRMRGIADYEKLQKTFLPLLFSLIEKRKNITSGSLHGYLPAEIIELLNKGKKVKSSVLKDRNKRIIFLTKNGKTRVYLGEEANRIFKLNIRKDKKLMIHEIKGNVANMGLVTGKVKVVLRERDLIGLRNRIVVAPMTSIKFVPYLKGIKGIVTDEGGIACHAAIISRELNIPCIIGTKIATKVLKDDDIIEMDANNGIIKIIKL